MKTIPCGQHTLTLFSGGEAHGTLLYAVLKPEEGQALWNGLAVKPAALAAIHGVDWNNDLSPWPAPKCFAKGEAFGGQGDAFLGELLEVILPAAEAQTGFSPTRRLIAGYSLAGFFALYSLYRTDAFQGAASVSGSLWFDGWLDFLQAHRPKAAQPAVYLSLGEREEHTNNPRLRTVGEATRKTADLLTGQGCTAALEWNPGGHFDKPLLRLQRGVEWLLSQP